MNKSIPRNLSIATVVFAGFAFSACEKSNEADTPKEVAPLAKAEAKAPTPSQSPAQSAPSATQEPGQVRTIMLGLGGEMERIQSGFWTENFDLIGEAAVKIADHPKLASSEVSRLKTTLGEDFSTFGAMDKAVHDGAIRVSEASADKDMPRVITEFSALQRNCVSCHGLFRTRLTK